MFLQSSNSVIPKLKRKNKHMDTTEIIEQIVGELLNIMNFEGQVAIDKKEENILVNIQTEEAGYLIGQAGANLNAFQHLVKVMLSKKINQPCS